MKLEKISSSVGGAPRKHPLDQVSRIMHAQHAMKHFLGGLSRPAIPQFSPAVAPSSSSITAATPTTIITESTVSTMPYPSFRKQVSDINTNVVCTMCDKITCSSRAHYMYMPTLAKPWIPICAACQATE